MNWLTATINRLEAEKATKKTEYEANKAWMHHYIYAFLFQSILASAAALTLPLNASVILWGGLYFLSGFCLLPVFMLYLVLDKLYYNYNKYIIETNKTIKVYKKINESLTENPIVK